MKYTKYYNTPKDIDIKWQLNIKYVPKDCYTVIDETSSEQFIYPYKEHFSYSTIYFFKVYSIFDIELKLFKLIIASN